MLDSNQEKIPTMQTKEFHLGDVLSITTGYLVSPRHMDGIYDILSFMMGRRLWTHELPEASGICKPYLLEQFPYLDRPEVSVLAVDELVKMLETVDKKDRPNLCLGWLSKLMCGKYGVKLDEMLTVRALRPQEIDDVSS